jgi:hypothetical protein
LPEGIANAGGAETLIELEVPVRELVAASVAVMVSFPTVSIVAEKRGDGLGNAEFAGRMAWESVLEKCTVPP